MRINRVCDFCGEPFVAIKKKHLYCKRQCFKRAYREKMKKEAKAFPSWKCPKCGKIIKLEFDPKKHYDDWARLKCPTCNTMAASNELKDSFGSFGTSFSSSSAAGSISTEIARAISNK